MMLIEAMWEALLSRQPDTIRQTFAQLSLDDQAAVLAHLHTMTSEDGWHAEQRRSAQAALDAIQGGRK